jgi:hypothetical protein
MTATNLIAVFVENKPGQTARVSKILAGAGVNLRWLTIAHSGSFGVMKFLVDKSDVAVRHLREKGLMVSLLPVLALETDDQPGALERVAEALGRRSINLDNCSGFAIQDRAILLVETHEVAQARTVLEGEGFRLLTEEEMLRF